jgi:hypothetical protein
MDPKKRYKVDVSLEVKEGGGSYTGLWEEEVFPGKEGSNEDNEGACGDE